MGDSELILEQTRKRLIEIIDQEETIHNQEVVITCKTLTAEEAIENPLHDNYPIQLGKEKMIEAEFMGKKGQAFSDAYLISVHPGTVTI